MVEIRETEIFSRWLKALRDAEAKARVAARIRRLCIRQSRRREIGRPRHQRTPHSLRARLSRLLRQRGSVLIVLLCGGDKKTQRKDIETAKQLAKEIE